MHIINQATRSAISITTDRYWHAVVLDSSIHAWRTSEIYTTRRALRISFSENICFIYFCDFFQFAQSVDGRNEIKAKDQLYFYSEMLIIPAVVP